MGSLRNCEPWSAQKKSTTTSEQLGLLVNILTGKYCDPKTATTITVDRIAHRNPFLLFGLFVAAVYILLPDNFPVQTLFTSKVARLIWFILPFFNPHSKGGESQSDLRFSLPI